ncbi:hypothetical protein TRFO_21772 [Tritrichomonas foetus]|uniref:Uncharacterized protein n=1 Tax=Tritrichomonas foetus TaxID=1144522 RepID=A0A1J4KEE1_9EUKA|nr:hypothetical protein TRFO_21772 [Tritrichomonas foetus]|eukprot:OHT09370.1 hypothetical protein TRFO_21772 [Tritrichomonas foetus]
MIYLCIQKVFFRLCEIISIKGKIFLMSRPNIKKTYMTLLERNPDAIRFNINKKLAQLNKVIFLFIAGAEERNFKKKKLLEIYDPKILETLDTFHQKMTEINEKVYNINKSNREKFTKLYTNKYETKKAELLQSVSIISENHNKQIEKQNETVSAFLEKIKELSTFLSNETSKFEKEKSQTIEYLKKYKKESSIKLKNDIYELNESNNSKINQLKEESQNKLHQMKKKHRKNLAKIKESYAKNPFAVSINYNNKKFQKVIHHKENIDDLIKENKIMLKNKKDEINDEIQNILLFKEESNKKLKMYKNEVRDRIKSLSVQPLKDELINLRNKFIENENNLEKQSNDVVHSNQISFEKRKAEIQEIINNLKNSQNKLEKELNNHFKYQKEIFDKEQQEKNEKIEKIESSLKVKINQNRENERKMAKELEINKRTHTDLIEALKKKNILEINETRMKNVQSISNMKNVIKESLAKNEIDKNNLKIRLNELNQKKSQIIEEGNNKNDLIHHQKEFESLNTHQLSEKIQIKEEEEEILKMKGLEENEKLENHKKYLLEQKNIFINKIKNSSNQSLAQLEETQKGKNQKEMDSYTLNFKNKETELLTILSSINTTNESCQQKFQELTKELENLQNHKSEKNTNNKIEKEELQNNMKKAVDEENKRHLASLSALKQNNSGRNRQQTIMSLKQRINSTIESRHINTKKLNEEKLNLEVSFRNIKKNFYKNREELIQKMQNQEDELTNDINHIQSNYLNRVSLINNEIENERIRLDKESEKLCFFYLNSKEKLFEKNISLISIFENEEKSLKEQLEKQHYLNRSKFSEETKNHDDFMFNMHNSHILLTKDLKERIKILSERVKSDRINFDDQRKRLISSNIDTIAQYEKGSKYSLSRIIDDNEGMNGFLDERIEVLESELYSLKMRMDPSKPREYDQRLIENLQKKLTKVSTVLSCSIADLKKYKTLFIDQENRVNKMLGSPTANIGLILSKSPR